MSVSSPCASTPVEAVTTEDYLDAIARHAAGVSVVTSAELGRPVGATVSTFASHSIDPPTVSCDLAQDSSTLATIRRAGRFAVHLLADDQRELAMRFAGRGDRFAGGGWSFDDGLPAIDGVVARFVCELRTTAHVGDHVVVFGTVTDTVFDADRVPLVHQNRSFWRIGSSIEPTAVHGA